MFLKYIFPYYVSIYAYQVLSTLQAFKQKILYAFPTSHMCGACQNESHTALFSQTILFLNLCLSAVPNRLTTA